MHEINSRVSRYLPVSPKNPVAWHSSIKVSAPYFSAKSHSSLSEEPPQVHVNWRLVQGVARKIQYIFTKYFLLYQFLYFLYLSEQTKLKNVIYKWLNWNSAKKIAFIMHQVYQWYNNKLILMTNLQLVQNISYFFQGKMHFLHLHLIHKIINWAIRIRLHHWLEQKTHIIFDFKFWVFHFPACINFASAIQQIMALFWCMKSRLGV